MKLYRIGQVNVHAVHKSEVLDVCRSWLESEDEEKRGYIVTPYSEFIVQAEQDSHFRTALNNAHLSLPDGNGTVWAGHILYRSNRSLVSFARSFGQLVAAPDTIRDPFPEKVSGADIIYDLLALCNEYQSKVYLLGATEKTQKAVRTYITEHYPRVRVVGFYDGQVDARSKSYIREGIRTSGAEVIITALSPPVQETWLYEEFEELPHVRLAIGLGGTLDYIAGYQNRAPRSWQKRGLEWLWRLFTQPDRLGRMYTATIRFTRVIWRTRNHPR